MGKTDGFLLYKRELPTKEPAGSRVKHYQEFQKLPSSELLNKQSARCMNCGIPFCQSGCPLGNVIPEFNDAVYNNQWKKAYDILSTTNNFPEFTGRICPAPCEGSCVLGINELPVTIEEIEKNIIETAFSKGYVKPQIAISRTGKKVAVVGSGPSGLAAADQLNKMGHLVTVFERDCEAGGLLRFGIPDFKLDKKIVERRIKLMEQEGVIFRTGVNVGLDYSAEELDRNFDVIILAMGSTVPRNLPIPNRDARGVYFAMEFLKQSNKRVSAIPYNENEINVQGKKVLVIGGGDTGSDCIGTANRQGATEVLQIEIMPVPPQQRDGTMPWPMFPMIMKTTTSHEEGCERKWMINCKEFIKDENGNLKGVRAVEVEWSRDSVTGRYTSFVEKPETEFTIQCDFAFLAMGFLHVQHKGLVEALDIDLDPRLNLIGNDTEYKTNQGKIFTCGDARRGQSLVVWAISEGRKCAERVNTYVMME
ncbi:glutamate synthase [Elizabethkingia meningoseptica]|uniref:glutamate synthase subunit beta n=1 Tax=Elizabethkingia meningoseptica TaxID=238 RepID=UPI000332CB04|nr:glutamate synthase subunit beta [Elizabethkingia meningoseptica]AQX05562.1 glutamate synthase [Elizabethkingia meningoseptica]AQX47607.1 glutamate synthase [Elizabethkingia meningoseptica]EOR30434.1 glutamate synthase NADH/NADPH small subunit [Elizabethkingia meningoseptica ATCC 13253 = NBRC 12535]KUY24128.1 glutamate synthase [Elizabethkingia meningoseptica]OPB67670.1 glutamate synthase [Elizabethkingia meningoseptica]